MADRSQRREPVRLSPREREVLALVAAGLPKDVVYAALYLASDESAWMTGSEFAVDARHFDQLLLNAPDDAPQCPASRLQAAS